MDPEKVLAYCDQIDVLTQKIRDEVLTEPVHPPGPITVVTDGGDLQTALNAGGNIELEEYAGFAGAYTFNSTDTRVKGRKENAVEATGAPAFTFPLGFHSGVLEQVELKATRTEVVCLIGKNTTDQTLENVPTGVVLHFLTNTDHRGKRCFEINGRDVQIIDCDVYGLYDPERSDSQAIWIGNSPGNILVEGGHFEAASECLMVGGDSMKLPNTRPTRITIRGAIFTKPLVWKGNADIPVKNLLELKDGHDVLIEDCDLSSCWKSAQDGYAFMFTPTRGGSLRNVVVKNCRVSEVGGLVNITGIDTNFPTLPRTQVTIIGGTYRTNKVAMGGSGRFALVTRGPEAVIVQDASITHEGSSFIDVGDSKPVDVLRVTGCGFNYGLYGIRIGGYNHGDNSRGQIRELVITGNTIRGAHSQFQLRYPNNTYVEMMSRDRERMVDSPEAGVAAQEETVRDTGI